MNTQSGDGWNAERIAMRVRPLLSGFLVTPQTPFILGDEAANVILRLIAKEHDQTADRLRLCPWNVSARG